MTFPIFPQFTYLKLQNKEEIEQITKIFPPYSDYNFTSLWSFNIENDIEISLLNENFVVKFRDYISNQPFYSFLGKNDVKNTISILLKFLKGKNLPPILKLIPEIDIIEDREKLSSCLILEDRDNFDYIYAAEDMAALCGSKYEKKRNKVNKFRREYPSAKTVLIDLKKKTVYKELFDVFSLWELRKKKQKDDTIHELTAIKRLLDASHIFELVCLGIYFEGSLKAFSITEVISDKYGIFHFVKGDPYYTGIFEFLYTSTAKELQKRGCVYINREQDLGISGLREAKSSWQPVNFLKKYTIAAK